MIVKWVDPLLPLSTTSNKQVFSHYGLSCDLFLCSLLSVTRLVLYLCPKVDFVACDLFHINFANLAL